MKKHLLFAAMLALSAAPVVANPVAPIYYEEGADASVEEQYQALVKSIKDLQTRLEAALKEVEEKYPLAETLPGTLKATLTGTGGLSDILADVTAKYEAGTLTSKDVTDYQATVDEWSVNFSEENLATSMKEAEAEHASGLLYQYGNEATDKISDAEAKLEGYAVYDYVSSVMDAYNSEIQMAQWTAQVATVEEANAYKVKFDELVAKALTVAEMAPDAEALVKDMKATLPQALEEMEYVRVNFPDYGLETMTETVKYWQNLLNELTDYIAEDAEPYTKKQIENFIEQFGYFKEEISNLRNSAQSETWQAEYNAKYYPVSNRISEISEILYDECPTVYGDYLTKLEDYNYEMTQAMMKFYNGTVTKEEFDAMMARVDEIAKEIEKVLEDARAAEAATGISHISIDQLGKDAKVYTLDGKRITTVQKGLYIVNGKKVVLK